MQISVIIPSYNRATLIRRALDSVRVQTHTVDEVIVIDDGSNDDTADVIEQHYSEVHLIRQSHAGVSRARNTGIRQSHGQWIALLDSDDAWQPEKLQRQVEYLHAHPGCRIIHTDETWIRNGKRVNPHQKHRKSGGYILQNCLPLCCISPSSVLIDRSVFDEIGLFDEDLPACEDYDLWLRICARYPVGFIKEPLISKYGGHDDQLSRQYWGMDRFRVRALLKLLDNDCLQPKDRQATLAMLVSKLKIVIQGAQKHNNRKLIEEYGTLLKQLESDAGNQQKDALPQHA